MLRVAEMSSELEMAAACLHQQVRVVESVSVILHLCVGEGEGVVTISVSVVFEELMLCAFCLHQQAPCVCAVCVLP
jgi:hypothetical protein